MTNVFPFGDGLGISINNFPLPGVSRIKTEEKTPAHGVYELFKPEPWATVKENAKYIITLYFYNDLTFDYYEGFWLKVSCGGSTTVYRNCKILERSLRTYEDGESRLAVKILAGKREVE